MVGIVFGLNIVKIAEALSNYRPLKGRMTLLPGIKTSYIIDDSYNGNPDGVRAAIRVLESFPNRRKIYVTPGLIELGEKSETIHLDIGNNLAKVADLIVLVDTRATKSIAQGLLEAGFDKEKILIFPNATETHKKVRSLIASNDVVLFQNDWPDGGQNSKSLS